uniref:Uncharacterized protein n=1 Tax=Serinus canaria TaxID=9135 RepID=A0A8C9UD89_SERCA
IFCVLTSPFSLVMFTLLYIPYTMSTACRTMGSSYFIKPKEFLKCLETRPLEQESIKRILIKKENCFSLPVIYSTASF